MDSLCISVKEMAKLLKISKPTAYKLIHTKGFPVLNLGRRKIIPRQKLEQWLLENETWNLK